MEIIIDGLLIMLIGMSVVFAFLSFLVLLMSVFKFIPVLMDQVVRTIKGQDKARVKVPKDQVEQKVEKERGPRVTITPKKAVDDETEVIIAAAVHAYLKQKEQEAKAAGEKRARRRTVWSIAHKYDMMKSRLGTESFSI